MVRVATLSPQIRRKYMLATESGAFHALPAIKPDTDNTEKLSLTDTTARTSAALSTTEASIYRFIPTADCYINIGDSSITSTTSKMLLKAGVSEYFVVAKDEYVSGITAATADLFITKAITASIS